MTTAGKRGPSQAMRISVGTAAPVSTSQRKVESAHTPNDVPSGRTASTHGWLW